jgi:hypothetical protein
MDVLKICNLYSKHFSVLCKCKETKMCCDPVQFDYSVTIDLHLLQMSVKTINVCQQK